MDNGVVSTLVSVAQNAAGFICLILAILLWVQTVKKKNAEKIIEDLQDVISRLTDVRAFYDPEHYERVAYYAAEIGRRMGKTRQEIKNLQRAAHLYDTGMLLVSDEVVRKPESLTAEEFDRIRVHPVSGYHYIRNAFHEDELVYAVKYHHERYDGTGYPDGLARKNIPEIARILAVADAFDSMLCCRSYRKALTLDEARNELEKGKGSQFDPEIADIMLAILDEKDISGFYQMEEKTDSILILDDDQLALNVGKAIIGSIPGCRVFTAQSFEQAEKILNKTRIDLVFLDLVMPGIDGFDAYEKIREKWDMPVVFMTSEKSLDIIMKASSLGAVDYLVKPSSHVVMKETVSSVLGRR